MPSILDFLDSLRSLYGNSTTAQIPPDLPLYTLPGFPGMPPGGSTIRTTPPDLPMYTLPPGLPSPDMIPRPAAPPQPPGMPPLGRPDTGLVGLGLPTPAMPTPQQESAPRPAGVPTALDLWLSRSGDKLASDWGKLTAPVNLLPPEYTPMGAAKKALGDFATRFMNPNEMGAPRAAPAVADPMPPGGRPLGDMAARFAPKATDFAANFTEPRFPGREPSPYQENVPPGQGVDLDRALAVVRKNESGNSYSIVGPEVKYRNGSIDRPYGAYQIMGQNIGPWTKQVLGRAMTPQEFLSDPQAQDTVARTIFGGYVQKHGLENAFAMWASGRPLSGSGQNRDLVFGTKVADTVAQRMADYGKMQPPTRNVMPAASPAGAPIPQMAVNWTNGAPIGQMAANWTPPGARPAATNSPPPPANSPPSAPNSPSRTPFDFGSNAMIWPTVAALASGMMAPTRFGRFGDAAAQGMTNAAQTAATAPDVLLKRQLMRADIGIKEIQVQQRDAMMKLARDPSLPPALQMIAGLGDAGKFVDAFMKLDSATQKQLAQNDAIKELIVGAAKLQLEGSPLGIQTKEAQARAQEKGSTQGKMEATMGGLEKQRAQTAPIVLQDIDRAINMAQNQSFLGGVTGTMGTLYRQVPGSPADNFSKLLDSIKSNVGLDQLNQLKALSGAGLGAVTEAEHALLQSVLGSLKESQTKDQLVANLQRVRSIYSQILSNKTGVPNPYERGSTSPGTPAPPDGFRIMR